MKIKIIRKNVSHYILAILIIVNIFGQRIGFYLGDYFFPLVVPLAFISTGLLYFNRSVYLSKKRLLFFIVSISGILFSSLIALLLGKNPSFYSFIYAIGLYIPTIIVILKPEQQEKTFLFFQICMVLAAIVGIFHFISQYYLGYFPDPFSRYSGLFVVSTYNYKIPLKHGSNIYKANGLFFLEPSFFSKWLAVAILIELYVFRNYKRLVLFSSALLITFSGTGLLILIIGFIPIIFSLRFNILLSISSIFLILITTFNYLGYLELLLQRLQEFSNPHSSAYIRFIAPYIGYFDYIKSDLLGLLIGEGAGSVDDRLAEASSRIFKAHPSFFIKALFEYGIFGISIIFYVIMLFFDNSKYLVISFCLFIMYSILGTGFLEANTLYLCHTLSFLYRKQYKKNVFRIMN